MRKFYIQTLGCKVNQYESDGIGSALEKKGWIKGRKHDSCDVFIVNTCAVTSKAGMQSRQAIRKFKRENPNASIIVTGCHAQTDPDEIKKIDQYFGSEDRKACDSSGTSDLHIISHKDKTKIADNINLICDHTSNLGFKKTNFNKKNTFTSFDHAVKGSMTRAYLKIQDGCESFCTYCIVPYARGSSVSMPQEEVLNHLKQLNNSGFKEVIITGIHTGMYGHDLKKRTSLLQLLKKINKEKPVHRIRLSSIEPGEINDGIIELAKKNNILCDHFHIPLQSGDDEILQKMKRPYNAALFEDIIHKINRTIPNAGIGVDTLIGFPGETEKQFQNTYNLIEKLPVSYLHIFPFSPRKGTPAFSFKNKVDSQIIKQRCEQMRKLDKIKRDAFITANINEQLESLVLNQTDKKTGMLKAVTSNYLTIFLKKQIDIKGTILNLEYDEYDNRKLISGKIMEN